MATKDKRPARRKRPPTSARAGRRAAHDALRGSVEVVGDLGEARAELERELAESVARTAAQLSEPD